ncbi:30S ribosomal protein S16 [Candidatus Cloacimonas acidaminovorans]|jgi:small subunit ribosomal protein S16|uniref:Small ribosomal subunit protein bS16 n=1 Tax=Cloacimonas acidaminovorans (strain Evry) TaxID=459349 RepID=B0VET0_CLOAI|nr:30S ribosomal protein S16 [Candidatus Cloacimonas acidaminovorans]NLM90137.1 30S ribosomal protein S16 [Candidatus Cloacimonadota bacterium]CAO81318.1 Ribosomal protein S16 [Candidatus Cloacimonas acidaminovorans str. Evry]HNV62298.1 30S ribosomal protein S16 [Candidatus Cloacimonas acidaminovorans]HOI02360.1 30S ribosomal protein S16 [Candidatus Cloacimonas acidaminovorans]HPV00374.1 30S ribosomal protein S16 [Candidatus Cloacimonas acidaminovorans]
MVKLRLRRMGAINQPFYRIVAVDSRKKRDGKYIECIGWYDPKPDPSKIKIDTERALYWLGVGAQPSDTVRSLLRKAGVLQIWHNSKQKKNQKTAEAE